MFFTYTPSGNHIVDLLQWSRQIVLKFLTRVAAHNVTCQARLDSLPHPAMAIGACPCRRSWCITIMWIYLKDLATVRTYQARDLGGSTYQTIANVNEWHLRHRNQGHLPLSQANAYHPWRRTKPICSMHRLPRYFIWISFSGLGRFEPIWTGSLSLPILWTPNWTSGLVLTTTQTSDQTWVPFVQVQVRTWVQDWTMAALISGS